MKAGQKIVVRVTSAQFADDGSLIYERSWRPATFVSHAAKPWYPGACIVDFGNGPRKNEIRNCRRLRWHERLLHPPTGTAFAIACALQAGW